MGIGEGNLLNFDKYFTLFSNFFSLKIKYLWFCINYLLFINKCVYTFDPSIHLHMKPTPTNILHKMETFFQRALGINPERMVKSISTLSQIVAVFAVLYLGAFYYKIFTTDNLGSNLKLTNGFKLGWLYQLGALQFSVAVIFESLRLLLIATAFVYLYRFIKSLDIEDPFANIDSKKYINRVALLSAIFFLADTAGAIQIKFLAEANALPEKVSIFHFEYLFLMYFIHIFAALFSKGVDLKNEINMVV